MQADLEKLKQASTGLLFISETDAPFEIVSLQKNTPVDAQLLLQSKKTAGTAIEKQDVDYFFRNMVKEYPSFTPAQKNTAQRFTALVKIIKETLHDVHVYRIGSVQVDVYIIGTLKDGTPAGLKTKLVET